MPPEILMLGILAVVAWAGWRVSDLGEPPADAGEVPTGRERLRYFLAGAPGVVAGVLVGLALHHLPQPPAVGDGFAVSHLDRPVSAATAIPMRAIGPCLIGILVAVLAGHPFTVRAIGRDATWRNIRQTLRSIPRLSAWFPAATPAQLRATHRRARQAMVFMIVACGLLHVQVTRASIAGDADGLHELGVFALATTTRPWSTLTDCQHVVTPPRRRGRAPAVSVVWVFADGSRVRTGSLRALASEEGMRIAAITQRLGGKPARRVAREE